METAQTFPRQAALLPVKLRNTRALWLVLIIMALLASLSLLFARGAMRLSSDWQTQLSDTISVQIILDNASDWDAQTEAARTALLDALPGADIEIVSQSDAKKLLQPWLGNTALPEDLVVPALLQVSGIELSSDRIKNTLDPLGLRTNIDDNSRYADALTVTTRKLLFVSLSVLALILMTGVCINIFATRAAMTAQKEIIRVLVQVGASDKFISNLFIRQAALRGCLGAFIGIAIAGAIWLLLSVFDDWFGLAWTGLAPVLIDIFWLVLLGFVFTLICAVAAGMTSWRQLSFERDRL